MGFTITVTFHFTITVTFHSEILVFYKKLFILAAQLFIYLLLFTKTNIMKLSNAPSKRLLISFAILMLSINYSCRKVDLQPMTITDSISNQLSKNSLGQNTSVDTAELKRLMESSNYRTSNSKEERNENFLNIIHFSKGSNNKLWIINLKEGTNGFKKAKLAASLKDGNFSLIFISYDYDTAIYKKNDFSTYTGTTSIFDSEMKKIGEFFYRKGSFINSSLDKKPGASMIVIHAPDNTDWCLVWPPLCEYQGGEGSGGDVTTLMASPDGAGGSGGSGHDDTDVNGFYYSRIQALNEVLVDFPFALEPCDKLNIMPFEAYGSMWQRVAQHQVPQSVKDRMNSLKNIDPLINWGPFYLQNLEDASGPVINCDFFPVRIKSLPAGMSSEYLIEFFRKNINSFIDPTVGVTFTPYNDGYINDNALFNSAGALSLIYNYDYPYGYQSSCVR